MKNFLIFFYFIFFYFCCDISFSKVEKIDQIISIVDNNIILESDIDYFISILKKNNKEKFKYNFNKNNLYKNILKKLIIEKIIFESVKKEKIKFSKIELDNEFKNEASVYGLSIDEFKKNLILNNINIEKYKNNILNKKVIEKLFNKNILPKVKVSKEELDFIFFLFNSQNNKENYFNLSHIFIPLSVNLSNLSFKLIEKNMFKVLRDAKMGLDFFDLKKKYSKYFFLENENVGWNKLKNLPDIFFHRIKYSKKKDIIGPILSSYGFHILKVNDIKYRKNIHNVLKIKTNYIFIKFSDLLNKKKKYNDILKILIKIKNKNITFSEAINKYSKYHDVSLDNIKNNWNLIDNYHIFFKDVLKKLKKGEISKPISFNSGWYLIKMEDKKIFTQQKIIGKNEIFNFLFKNKFNNEIEYWIRKKSRSSYIKIFEK